MTAPNIGDFYIPTRGHSLSGFVLYHNSPTGTYIETITLEASGNCSENAIKIHKGIIYVLGHLQTSPRTHQRLYKIDPQTNTVTMLYDFDADCTANGDFVASHDNNITWDSTDNIYVTALVLGTNRSFNVYKLDSTGTTVLWHKTTDLATSHPGSRPYGATELKSDDKTLCVTTIFGSSDGFFEGVVSTDISSGATPLPCTIEWKVASPWDVVGRPNFNDIQDLRLTSSDEFIVSAENNGNNPTLDTDSTLAINHNGGTNRYYKSGQGGPSHYFDGGWNLCFDPNPASIWANSVEGSLSVNVYKFDITTGAIQAGPIQLHDNLGTQMGAAYFGIWAPVATVSRIPIMVTLVGAT